MPVVLTKMQYAIPADKIKVADKSNFLSLAFSIIYMPAKPPKAKDKRDTITSVMGRPLTHSGKSEAFMRLLIAKKS